MHLLVREIQDHIVEAVEGVDGRASFRTDEWTREEGGGGLTKVLEGGAVFDKAGVNTSAVYGEMPSDTAKLLNTEPAPFFATGVSLVIHPVSPFAPTVHANFRYFGMGEDLDEPTKYWFGGGADLTPVYPFVDDARHFHRVWKDVCGRHDCADYAEFKTRCDEYFFLPHRDETRGIGGIFYDYLQGNPDDLFALSRDAGMAFTEAYLPIVRRRMDRAFDDRHRAFQELRRGRYAEFNLLFDRGTRFGVQTGGRTESILMSLPPRARWVYNWTPEKGSAEEEALHYFRSVDWLGDKEIARPSYERTADTKSLP